MLKTLLQMNSNSLVIKKNQRQANKQFIYMKIQFQNSIVRLSFLCHVTDIKISWVNPWSIFTINDYLIALSIYLKAEAFGQAFVWIGCLIEPGHSLKKKDQSKLITKITFYLFKLNTGLYKKVFLQDQDLCELGA